MISFDHNVLREEQPLKDRTIVVTRALSQAVEFNRELERYGARVISFPTIEIVPPESFAELDDAIANLHEYDWIIFTSVNGVDYFLQRFEAAGRDNIELDDLRVCAVGTSTANRLGDMQVHVDVVPDDFKAEGVFLSLERYFEGRDKLRGLRCLLPQAAVTRDYLPQKLQEAGARVRTVPAYQTVRPQPAGRGRLSAMLVGGSIDCVTFTSSSTISNFAHIFETTDLGQLLDGVAIACIGDITARTAADYNLAVDIQPHEHTTHALACAVARYYLNLKSSG